MAIENSVARLSRFSIFEGLSAEDLARVGTWVDEMTAWPGQELYRQGDLPDNLYLVEAGEVVEVGREPDGQVNLHRVAQPGDLVGRRSALENERRLATATVREDARLLTISTANLRVLLGTFPILRDRLQQLDTVNRLAAIPLFSNFSTAQLLQVADLVRVVTYVAGQTIFVRGELADAMYVIDTGQVVETVDGVVPERGDWPKYLAAGNFFGRHGLRTESPRRATAVAATDVRLFRINQDGFNWLLRFQPEFSQALTRPDMIRFLRATSLFSRLDEEELRYLAGFVGLAHYRPGQTVFRQGESDQTLFILYNGGALVRSLDIEGRERPRDYLQPGAVQGEMSLFLRQPHLETVEAVTGTDWMYLSWDDLQRFLAERPDVREKLVVPRAIQTRQPSRRYDWMDLDERVLFQDRRHWFVLSERLTPPALMVLIGLLMILAAAGALRLLLTVLAVPLAAGGLLWLLWRVIDWLNDLYIITTRRVVHIERVLGIRESVDEAPLDKVQNINLSRGFWGNLVGFGTLLIETAAPFGAARVRFDYVAKPEVVQDLIFTELGRVRAEARHEARRTIREKLATRIGATYQPIVPPVATARFVEGGPPPPRRSWFRRIYRSPWRALFWVEHRTAAQITWRKHWIRLLARVWMPTVAILLVFAALLVYLALAGLEGLIVAVAVALALVLPLAFWWWWGWENWRNDLYIATNDRLIDIERLPLGFSTKRTETMFDKVQNVSYAIPNPLATLLDFGTVIIHTAGAQGRLDFEYVSHPRKVQTEIFRRLTAYDEARRRKEREERWADLPDWFASYAELNRPRAP